MTVVVFPVNAVTGAPEYNGRDIRVAQSVMLPGATSARPLGATSGVRKGTPSTTVTATSLLWTVNPHAGVLDEQASALAGPYTYAVTVAETGAVTAAHATYPRKDIVWVRIDDPAEADGSSVPAVVVGYTAGTAAASPAAPATPARSMRLATLTVPASGGGAPTVDFDAPVLDGPLGELVESVAVTATGYTASAVLGTATLIAAATYDRVVEVYAMLNYSVSAASSWQAVVTSSGSVVTTNVVGKAIAPWSPTADVGGSATVAVTFDLAAGATAQPKLWAQELSGTGTFTSTSSVFQVRVRPAL